MNTSVLLFFIHNVIATALLGRKFYMHSDAVLKNFGIALLLDGVAFAIWSYAVYARPANLEQYVSFGVIFFLASLIFLLMSGTHHLGTSHRSTIIGGGIVIAAIIFYLRSYVYPSSPEFSVEGFFFFNPHPTLQMLYVLGLALAALPAIEMVASKFKKPMYATLVRYGFIIEVVGGIILITSTNSGSANVEALYLTGWLIGVTYFILWTTLVFNKKAWTH